MAVLCVLSCFSKDAVSGQNFTVTHERPSPPRNLSSKRILSKSPRSTQPITSIPGKPERKVADRIIAVCWLPIEKWCGNCFNVRQPAAAGQSKIGNRKWVIGNRQSKIGNSTMVSGFHRTFPLPLPTRRAR